MRRAPGAGALLRHGLTVALGALALAPAAGQLGLQEVVRGTPHATLSNPALSLPARLTVQVASYGTSTQLSFRPRDIGAPDGGRLVISPEAIRAALPEEVRGRLGLDVSTVIVNCGRDWGQFGFHHALRGQADVRSPRAALLLVAEGNRVVLGRPAQVLPQGYAATWHEFGGHYARRLTGGVTVGARAKLLLGASDLRMADPAATVAVSPVDFAVEYDIAATGYSAGYGLDFGADSLEALRLTLAPGAGVGAAVDLGIVYAPDRRWAIGLGLRDLGAIRWRGRRHDATGAGVYVGAEGDVFAEEFSLGALASYDSVRALVGLRTRPTRYGRGLPAKLTAHARYDLSRTWTVGAVSTALLSAGRVYVNAAGTVLYEVWEGLHVGGAAGLGGGGAFAGVSLDARLGPVAVYASTEQALGLLAPYATRNTHGRLGVALVWE